MTNIDEKVETSLALFEKKAKPNKFKFFTYEPNKNEFLKTKMFKLTTKKDFSKYETSKNITYGYWAKSDHEKFIEALYLYDCDWKKIGIHVKNRTHKQIHSHAQKFYLKLKIFKDEELGLDFTTPDVKSLKDIIKIIREKELISENCGKLLFIISKKLSFGKNIYKKELNRLANINQENQLNNYEFKNENNNNINNIMQLNEQELSAYTSRINEQFLNSFQFDLLLNNNNFSGIYLDNIIINEEQKNDIDIIFEHSICQ